MAVMQYQPTTDALGSMLEDLLTRPFAQGGRIRSLLRAPDADVVETEEGIRVLIDAPGMTPSDIEIGLENNVLTVSGSRQPEWHESEEVRYTWHLAERRYGKFNRSFVLPRDVDADRIEARFENGVLRIHVPKSERARRRRIEIQADGGSQRIESATGD